MFSKLRSGITYANVVATLALFVALGGGAYAAVKLPKNSVGAKQIKKNAVRSGEVRDRSLRARDFRPGDLPAGARGPGGPAGATGPAGPRGAAGAPFDANATLPRGQTLTGVWGAAGSPGQNVAAPIHFSPQLPAGIPAGSVHRLQSGTTSVDCPGPGRAARGHLCVYERGTSSVNFNVITDPSTGANGAHRRGAIIQYTGAAGSPYADGTWAVTAP